MTHRENFLAAMRRQPCERVPFQFSFCDSLKAQLLRRCGTGDVVQAFDMPVQYVELPPPAVMPDYTAYHKNAAELSFIDEWGVGHKRGSVAHFTHFYSPMAQFTTPEEVEAYPFPDVLNEARWEDVARQVEKAHGEGRAAAYFAVQVFEPAWYLRGLENMLMDFLTDEKMAAACMGKMCRIQCEIARRAARCGVDMVVFGDDVGSQRSLMMSREVWRRWVKPATAATIAAAKEENPTVIAMYHSDGVIDEIIPELIEIGVEVLNPVQPECMDPVKVKELYGDRLSFLGTVGTQTVMPFGTPGEVRETVRRMIETVGRGGGLTIAPTHMLEPEVPWENIEAFLSAVKEFGGY